MNFYLFIKMKKGGGVLVHVYVREHKVSPNYRIVWCIFKTPGRDRALITPHICNDFWAKFAQGWIQGRAKIGHEGSVTPQNFFFRPEGYSNIRNA